MEDGSIITKLLKEHEIANQFSLPQLLAIEKISSETFKEMMKEQHSLKETFQDKYLGLGLEINDHPYGADVKNKDDKNTTEDFKPCRLPPNLVPKTPEEEKRLISEMYNYDVEKIAVNGKLRDLMSCIDFIIKNGILKSDTKAMNIIKETVKKQISDLTDNPIDIDHIFKVWEQKLSIYLRTVEITKTTTGCGYYISEPIGKIDSIGQFFDFREETLNLDIQFALILFIKMKFNKKNWNLESVKVKDEKRVSMAGAVNEPVTVFKFTHSFKNDGDVIGEFSRGPCGYLKKDNDFTKTTHKEGEKK